MEKSHRCLMQRSLSGSTLLRGWEAGSRVINQNMVPAALPRPSAVAFHDPFLCSERIMAAGLIRTGTRINELR